MRKLRAAALGLLLAATLTACVPPAAQRPGEGAASAQSAADLLQQGEFEQAAQAYLSLAAQDGSNREHYRLLAAEAYRQEGSLDRAAPILAQVRRERLDASDTVLFDLLRAEQALQQNDAQTAQQLVNEPSLAVPPNLEPRLLELRARAAAGVGDYWTAARNRVQLDENLQGLDRAQNRKQALELLGKIGAAPLQQRAAAMQQGDRMLPWINEALTQLGVAVPQPQSDLGQPVGTQLPGDANVREGYQAFQRIALLLPASGPFAGASTPVREGFFAAYTDASRNNAPRPLVRSYDSGGNGPAAVKAYQQAVADGAQLIVGPLTRDEVSAIFAQSSLPVPVLALNHPDGQALPPAGASEFGLLPETEGALAADHMIETGLRKAYVVASSEDFAQRAARSFKAEFESKGGNIGGMGSIDPAAVNYASTIRGLNASSDASNPPSSTSNASNDASPAGAASSGTTADTSSQPAGGAGVFISMRPQQARLLLPQLKLQRINLPVFATSHVYAGTDDAGANSDLNDLEFCDAPWLFDAQPGLPNHNDVAALLPAARGTSARLFAFGMDAWNLVPYINWLHAHPGSYLPGASGQLTADQFGRVRRVLGWAKFQDGLAHPLGGSLQMDNVPSESPTPSTPLPGSSNDPAGPASPSSTGG